MNDPSQHSSIEADAPKPGLLNTLPGQLFILVASLVILAMVLVYFPATAAYRVQWMSDRAEAAHIAALAADVAPGGALGEMEVGDLLAGAEAVAVSRVRGGMNELILYAGPITATLVESDLRSATMWDHIRDTTDALFAPEGRLLRIRAEPMGRPGEVIDVIVPERPLKEELSTFSRRLLWVSLLIAVLFGSLVYLALFFLFVRPMRHLAGAMVRFRKSPEDPSRVITPGGRRNEIGQAEVELALMQSEIRQALHQRERLAALGAAVSKINHDLRNVLTSAQLVSDRLAMDSDERVRKMGERLVRSVDRGVRLCEATLEFGRAEESAPELQPVNLHDLVDEAADDAMASEGRVEWNNGLEPDLVVILDADHMHRIFLNLFRNAIQAMATTQTPPQLSVRAKADEKFLHVEVSDNGPGIPPKARASLFQAFTGSTRKGGTGLGLAIARELVRAHGGEMLLVRTDEAGTAFLVCLPREASR